MVYHTKMWGERSIASAAVHRYNPDMPAYDQDIAADLLDRFVRYARIETTYDRHADTVPSTPGQWELLRLLEAELRGFEVNDVSIDDHGFLIARLPANREGADSIGFMAHVDTVSDVSGANVDPIVHDRYDGQPIRLAEDVVIDPSAVAALARYVGDTIITSDGTTLLGADDKAGVAEIMSLAKLLIEHEDIAHGEIELIFTPDEETGRGMSHFPIDDLHAVACYTLDGSEEGMIEAECFNASKAEVVFHGVSIHTGTARGKLVNANSMLGMFLASLPRTESPEATDGRYGFYAPIESFGSVESARCSLILRDFDADELARRERAVRGIAAAVEAAFPGGRAEVEIEKQYENMRMYLEADPRVVSLLEEAIRATGIEPVQHLIRGGTDGARLSALGVPTPNIFTGGHSYHSRSEWAALPAMVRAVVAMRHLCELWAEA